ncbi:unnamed protein product [Trichogramma brassicae]|uniref:Spaetzle domain-containing protein n=1 Tax=Trichogramma brassicae TaxID=86971 RepID=A0A6H5IKI0_9HYME|nr:unnamed protein product [Trichogramma brassicae]
MILLFAACLAEDADHVKGGGNSINNPTTTTTSPDEPPEGYYAFVESPNAEPPKVRPPPYANSDKECHETGSKQGGKGFVSVHNICGDLNKGFIPKNPMNHKFGEQSYPFELIKNHTLKFLSKALPILKADDSLPKVAKVQPFSQNSVCMLYKAIQGEPLSQPAAERRDDPPSISGAPNLEYRQRTPGSSSSSGASSNVIVDGGGGGKSEYTGPPTPCPAKVEYATPVFAKNYQGVWRYVVQIPYEGYFTQTIEVTRCMQSRCHYLDGGCLSSPRWTSLLVAEIFYPDTFLEESGIGNGVVVAGNGVNGGGSSGQQQQQQGSSSNNGRFPGPRDPVAGSPPPVHDFQNYQQYLQKRAGESEGRSSGGTSPSSSSSSSSSSSPAGHHCDGVDDMGCFQVRLYYDWFLVPGSCKCWRPDYFNRYVRRSNPSSDL